MDVLQQAEEAERHMRAASDLLKDIHDRLYALDTDAGDIIADEFAAGQWEVDFALERLPATIAKARRYLKGRDGQA